MDDTGGTLLLVGVTFLAVGAIQLGLGIFFFARTRRFLRTAVETTGTIVDVVESRSSEGGTTYKAVQFQTARRPRHHVDRDHGQQPARRSGRGADPDQVRPRQPQQGTD